MKPQASKKVLREVKFFYTDSKAQSVSLVGDFNQWNPAVNPLRRMPDGAWYLSVELPHGHHRYAFMVDGVLTLDPRAQGITRDEKGVRVCLVAVSGF